MPRGLVPSSRKWRELARINGQDRTAMDPTAETAASPSDKIEAVLRRAFGLADVPACGSMGIKLVPGPSPGSISVEFSDALTKLIWDLSGGPHGAGDVERVVCGLLNEKMVREKPGGSAAEVLTWLKRLAVAPGDPGASDTWREAVLRARRELFVAIDRSSPGAEELPYSGNLRKKRRGRQFLCRMPPAFTSSSDKGEIQQSKCCSSTHPELCTHAHCEYANGSKRDLEMLNQPRRRSERSLCLVKLCGSDVPRKRVPVGPFFQADVPEWTGSSNRKTVIDHKEECEPRWLGTQLWPIGNEDMEQVTKAIGRGRPDLCSCRSPSSSMCIRYHIKMARRQLKSELGHAFTEMGFYNMGEEVSNFWSWDQQKNFETLVRLNPISENKTFWYHALASFPSKARQDIVSYYFNVYVPRRMSLQTKGPRETIDSDDDEWSGQTANPLYPSYTERRHL